MPVFVYTARTDTGQKVEGTVSADNERAALAALDRRRLFPMEVKAQTAAGGGMPLFGRRVNAATRCRFYRQLADLLRAGLPILRALTTLERQTTSPRFKPVLEDVRLAISGGSDLADALANHPDIFEELEIGMVRAGERGGFLEEVLMRLAQFTERAREVRSQITGALAYPAVLSLAGIGVVITMMVFVLPAFAQMLSSMGELPLPTRIVMGISDFLRDNFLLLFLGIAAGVAGIVMWARTPGGRLSLDSWRLRIPILKSVASQVAIARFARTLGTLLSSGIPISQALKISADAAGNRILGAEILAASERVRQGETLAAPLADSAFFPPMLVEMIAVGEETGSLDKVLIEAAIGYEREADRAVSLLVRLLEPLVLMVMTGLVLVVALAVILPALNAAANLGK